MKERDNLGNLRKDISTFKTELTKIKQEKENWFKEKEELKKQIFDLIKKIKTVKSEKDSFNDIFKNLRNQRDELNKTVRKLIGDIKVLRKERKKVSKEVGISLSHEKIKEKIKQLNDKIETEILSLKKEESFMAEIKNLKKSLIESKAVVELDNKINSMSELIEQTKVKSQEYHQKLKDHINKHKKNRGYKDFINLSRQIEFMKKKSRKCV